MDIDPEEIPDRENPFEPVDPGDDNEGESIPMTSTSAHDPVHRHYETSFGDTTPLIEGWDRTQASIEFVKNTLI